MLNYPSINPIIVKLGPLQIRWYGVMYILGFMASYLLVRYQIRKKGLDIRLFQVDFGPTAQGRSGHQI